MPKSRLESSNQPTVTPVRSNSCAMCLDTLHYTFSLPGRATRLPFGTSAPPRFREKPIRFDSFDNVDKEPM